MTPAYFAEKPEPATPAKRRSSIREQTYEEKLIAAKKLRLRGAPPKRGKRKIGRNALRKIREFGRCFGSKERVAFVQRLQCMATGQFASASDPIDNAHVCDDGTKGIGRRSGYRCIAPLKRSAHRLLHRNPEKFYATYGAFDWKAAAAYTENQWQKFAAREDIAT